MMVETPEKLYEMITNTITIWATGIKKDKVSGYIKINFKGDITDVSLRYSIAINRVMIKKIHEIRGFVEIIVKKSVKTKNEELLEKLNNDDNKIKHLFNMNYYMLAQEGQTMHSFMKYLNEIIGSRDTKTTLILPPFIPDFIERLNKRLKHIYYDLKKAYNYVNPTQVTYKINITGKKSEIIIGEALGRTVKLLTTEYADNSNVRNIKRMLARHGGLALKEVDALDAKWKAGVKKLLEISLKYLMDLSKIMDREELLSSLAIGIRENENTDYLKYYNAFNHLLDTYKIDRKLTEEFNTLIGEAILNRIKSNYDPQIPPEIKEIIDNILKGEVRKSIKEISDRYDKDKIIELSKHILTTLEIDRETRFAIVLELFKAKNIPDTTLVEIVEEKMIVNEESLLGSLISAIKAINKMENENILIAHQKLAKHVSRFTFSDFLTVFPYSSLIPYAYRVLAKLEELEGKKEYAKKALALARRIENIIKER